MGLFSLEDFLGSLIVTDCTINQEQLGREVIRDLAVVHHDSSSVTMETGKPGLVSAPVHSSSVAAQKEKKMDIQAPLTAVYIHTVPALPPQPYPQAQPLAAPQEPATLHLAMPPLYSKETLPFLTLHIAGGLQSQQQGLSLAAAAPVARPKSAGKHVCPHCGRDCMKPSVLEKHLRCHTGERPYPCTTCGVSFKTQSNLYKHKRTQAHARLSSESEQSSLSSQESPYSSRETCTSSLSLEGRSEELGSLEKDVSDASAEITCPVSTAKVHSVKKQGQDTGWASVKDPVSEKNELTAADQRTKPNESLEKTEDREKQKRMENEKPPLAANRHLPLQRQQATLFSKQWESSVSRGKSQSHESTDSGFSESSEQYPSPGSVIPDHSMDSLTESAMEHLEQPGSSQTPSESGQSGQEPKDCVSEKQQKTLEERISRLISENSAVVEDKHLENVRPRKTVLSKQGSIDLPMPYTYKDSFHFDMRISKAPNAGLHKKPGLYSSVPTQHSTSMTRAPLTRSSSLPFSVTLLQPERSSPSSAYQNDYVTLVRRGSSGQINPTGFAIKSVDQQASTHRPLVRQTAVDCNHATDGLFMNTSMEEACTSSLSCDGDASDICGEPSNRKFRRKKAQKFAYNKWYMYGGGTFKKLYNAEKPSDNSVFKGRKSLTNPEHEVVQGIQKRLSAVHKDTVTTTGSTINSTSSSATVCHPCCLPANLPPVSGVDFSQRASQLHSSCTSLKTPLLRNPSLSTLQLSSTGSSVTHNTDSISRAEAERLINKEKHIDSISQVCGAHIPSDRKKQRTDDKIICPLGMETDPNTLTQQSPSVTGSVPKQDTNITYINPQTNQKLIQLTGTLFPPCIINANGTSVSTSPAISMLSTTKTSFLPKYQLKLPNAAEPDSNPSSHTLNQPTGTSDPNFTSGLSSSHTQQTTPAITTSTASDNKCTDPLIPLAAHTHNIKKTSSFSSAQGQLVFPFTATTLCQVETSVARLNQNMMPNPSAAHRQFTTITTATTSMHDHRARLCTTLMQSSPSKPVVGSSGPIAPVIQNSPAMPIVTTEKKMQLSAAGVTAFSQNLPLSHTHPSSTPDQPNPMNRVTASLNAPSVPCHIVPFDSVQPSAQNVFHVHTADLQICLQIISDEQLALIEPQIERQVNTARTSLPQRNDLQAMDPEVVQSKVQSSITVESTNDGRYHEKPGHQKEMDQREPSPSLNTEKIKPSLSGHFQKPQPNALITEQADVSQATVLVESTPSESSGLSVQPHKHGHVNTVTEAARTLSHATPTVALQKGIKSGRSQTSEEDHVFSVKPSAEDHLLPDRNVSQVGPVSETLSGQQKLCLAGMTSLSHSTAAENSTGAGLLHKGSQHKLIDQRATYGEPCLSLQPGLGQASNVESVDAFPRTLSSSPISNCKALREVNPQAPIYSRDLVDSRLGSTEILQSSKHANMGSDRVGPLQHSAPSQDMTVSESQDVTSSALSEKHLGQFTSVTFNNQVERPNNVTAVLSTSQSPITGLTEGGSLAGCAAQKEPEMWGQGGTPGQPDSADWEPKQSQEAGETDHQCMEGQESGGVTGENKNGGMRSIRTEEVLGQGGKSESNCRHLRLPDMISPEEEERKVKTDSYKNSLLSEQDQQHRSQTETGMSEYPPQPPQQGPSTSNNLNSPVSSHTILYSTPQPELDMNHFHFSQQPWEIGSTNNQQTQILRDTSVTQHVNQQSCLGGTQHAFSQIESSHEQTQKSTPSETFSQQEHRKQDHKQATAALPVEILPPRETSAVVNNNSLASCSNKSVFEGCTAASISSAAKTSPSTHPNKVSHSVHVSGAPCGTTQATSNKVLDSTAQPSKLWTSIYPQPDDKQLSEDRATHDHMTQSSNLVRTDITNKYQSLFSAGQLHCYQPPECLTGGVRPVQSCQDYPDDTSSSDDEGKLIIEL